MNRSAVCRRIQERADVGIEHPVHPAPAETDPERVQRLMLIAPGSEPVGEAEKVRLIDGGGTTSTPTSC
jgi:hypothetical protein